MTEDPSEGWQRLGDEIVSRRIKLGMHTREAFAARIALSYRSLSDLEQGKRKFRQGTHALIEQALGWTAGSARNVINGGKPELVSAAPANFYRTEIFMRIKDIEIDGEARWTGETTTWDNTKISASFHHLGYTNSSIQFEFYVDGQFPAIRVPLKDLRKLAALAEAAETMNHIDSES